MAGITLMVPVAMWGVLTIGWRATYVLLGLGVVVLIVPLTLCFVRESPEAMGLTPDGLPPAAPTGEVVVERTELAGALQTLSFWQLSLGRALRGDGWLRRGVRPGQCAAGRCGAPQRHARRAGAGGAPAAAGGGRPVDDSRGGRTAVGYQTLIVERTGAIATIVLNRPDARNAIDLVMRQELVGALDEVEADEAARVLILTGAGGHFCAGGDVKSMRARRSTAAEGRARVELLNRMVLRLVDFPRPTIAMVDGYAVGAGTNLALCCDLVVASERARFGELFNKIGLVPDGGGTWLLSRLVGLARAKELIFTGEIFDAAEAERIGLVNRVVPAAELERATRALAEKIVTGPPVAQRLAKHMVNRAATSDLAAALDLEAYSQGLASASDDHQEGLAAFFDKRTPKFTGR
jgi:2-(1,2-epoxy-1,2-dihydrophenyl)acetyl-CoA isomerase